MGINYGDNYLAKGRYLLDIGEVSSPPWNFFLNRKRLIRSQ